MKQLNSVSYKLIDQANLYLEAKKFKNFFQEIEIA
jgi:hypothetical protein